jgi:hypothetical protein
MSEVLIKFNTETKAMEVTVGGKAIENVQGVSFYEVYSYDEEDAGKFECSITTESRKNADGMRERTYLYAAESQKGKEAIEVSRASASEIPGYVKVTEKVGTVLNDVSKYFGG